MKVLFLTHYELLLGANRSLLNLLEELLHYGVEPLVFMPRSGQLQYKLEELHIPFKIINFQEDTFVYHRLSRVKGLIRHFNNLLILSQLKAEAIKFSPQIIYSNSSVIFSGARLAKELQLPHVWHIREYGKVDYNLGYNFGYQQFNYWADQAAALIAISNHLKQKRLMALRPPVYTIYNGVGKTSFFRSFTHTKSEQQIVFLNLGIIHPSKGQLQAIEAFRIASIENPNTKLRIVGKIEDKKYFQKLQNEAKGLHIEFEGYVNNPFEIYAASDVFLMCSPNEAMGRVTAEALCCGLPVIGFDGGATTELLCNVGLLYRSTEELARLMIELSLNQTLRQQMGKKSKEFGLQNFTQEAYAKQVFEVLKRSCTPVSESANHSEL